MDFKERYGYLQNLFEENLNKYAKENFKTSNKLDMAMEYCLLSGGKRLRPVLFLSAGENAKNNDAIRFAIAIEMIHTYSLVHDDLPCIDDDDLRRGKPTCHKQFDEATAVLAGDALLTNACEILFELINDQTTKMASGLILNAAHSMLDGQMHDIQINEVDEKILKLIHQKKTAALILASMTAGFMYCKDPDLVTCVHIGSDLGLLFQLTDDILDAAGDKNTVGKNVRKDGDKLTAVKVYGLEKAKKKAAGYMESIQKHAAGNPKFDFYVALAKSMAVRDK